MICTRCAARSPWPKVEAAHVGLRGLGIRCPDRQAIPLCMWHHTMGPESHHVLGRKFWDRWELDRWELIAEFNERYEKERAA